MVPILPNLAPILFSAQGNVRLGGDRDHKLCFRIKKRGVRDNTRISDSIFHFKSCKNRTSRPIRTFSCPFTCQSYLSLNSFSAHLMAPIQFSTGLNRVPYLVNRATCLPRLSCALLTNVGHVTSHGRSPACLSQPHCFLFSPRHSCPNLLGPTENGFYVVW